MIYSLTPYLAIALGLIASLALFLSLKRELFRQTNRQRRQLDEIQERIQSPPALPEVIPPAPVSGLNVHKRVRAMRLLRRGEDVSHIAAALGVPRREVELLIRVQQLVARTVSELPQRL